MLGWGESPQRGGLFGFRTPAGSPTAAAAGADDENRGNGSAENAAGYTAAVSAGASGSASGGSTVALLAVRPAPILIPAATPPARGCAQSQPQQQQLLHIGEGLTPVHSSAWPGLAAVEGLSGSPPPVNVAVFDTPGTAVPVTEVVQLGVGGSSPMTAALAAVEDTALSLEVSKLITVLY
jgi:hypothetical protein